MMSERGAAFAAVMLAMSAVLAALVGGGVLTQLRFDVHIPSDPPGSIISLAGAVAVCSLLIVLGTGILIFRHPTRRPIWIASALLAALSVSVLIGELFLRSSMAVWPARALHGVPPAQWTAAVLPGRAGALDRMSFNSWGQRDRERTLAPPAGTQRIAFIGDSFLEEGADLPISLAMERKLATNQIEVLNLGVSATGPDEYFERLRAVATPLGVTHCYLFLFAGNDFVSPARTLPSYWGIASVEPRPALLTNLGLAGWNNVLTNHSRPVIQAWLQGASLAHEEAARAQILAQASDDEMRSMLLSASELQAEARERFSQILRQERTAEFFQMLRLPDAGKFRSYYLTSAIRAAADEDWTWEQNSEVFAWEWTEQAVRYCQTRQIGLTIVVIPEAFQVDDRMRDQWLPLADLRKCTAPCRDAAAKFVQRASGAELDVIDLQASLQGQRGTYLNLDGHWSRLGVENVSTRLAKHWRERHSNSNAEVHE